VFGSGSWSDCGCGCYSWGIEVGIGWIVVVGTEVEVVAAVAVVGTVVGTEAVVAEAVAVEAVAVESWVCDCMENRLVVAVLDVAVDLLGDFDEDRIVAVAMVASMDCKLAAVAVAVAEWEEEVAEDRMVAEAHVAAVADKDLNRKAAAFLINRILQLLLDRTI